MTELSDEQQEALDDWLWYERGDYTSENWYHIGSDGTVEMHGEYGSTDDTYTAYPRRERSTTWRALTSARTMCLS